jgi:transcriptional regulator of acetoin/glycerol metabolism
VGVGGVCVVVGEIRQLLEIEGSGATPASGHAALGGRDSDATKVTDSRKRWVSWNDVGREVQLAQWREAIEAAKGNITEAGRSMGFSRSYAFRLTRDHELNEYARELRKKSTGRTMGRPWKKIRR